MTDDKDAGQADWSALRARYEAGEEKVKDIAAAAGMSAIVLANKAKALGWKLRANVKKVIGKAKPSPKKQASTRDTLKRLKDLLQERVAQLEDEVKQLGLELDAVTNERQIKSVNLVVRTLEKVLDLERKDKLKRKQQSRDFKHYDDEQRRALAEKIERLEAEEPGAVAEPDAGPGGGGRAELPVAVLGEATSTTATGGD
jgi:uncharacterized protein (UPF0335 family)